MITKVFRDIIDDNEQHTIKLATKTGSLGYRIIRFDVMQNGFANSEMVLKIFKRSPDAITNVITFSDTNLLAAAMISAEVDPKGKHDRVIIFDTEIINQDIFITAAASSSGDPTNYYLELEQVKLSDNENFYVSLKDIKSKLPQHGP